MPAAVLLHSSQRDYLHQKLKDLEARIAASKGQRQATDREKRLAAAAAQLKKEVPGGRTMLRLRLCRLSCKGKLLLHCIPSGNSHEAALCSGMSPPDDVECYPALSPGDLQVCLVV